MHVLCLRLADARTGAFARRVCSAPLRVRRCQFCARAGDTLRSLALEFDTDWLQLWGANVGVADPDALAPAAAGPADPAAEAAAAAGLLHLGPVYRATADTAAAVLAATFEVPLRALLTANPDLMPLFAAGRPVPAGAEVGRSARAQTRRAGSSARAGSRGRGRDRALARKGGPGGGEMGRWVGG